MIHQTCIFKTVSLVKAVNSENICLPASGITREYMCPANGRGDRMSGMNNPMALGYMKIVKYLGLTFAVGCLPICCVLTHMIDIMLRVGLLYI